MNTAVIMEVARGVAPGLLLGLVACVAVVLWRKGRPASDASGSWVAPLLMGVGCAAGAVWLEGNWRPGAGGSSWLPTMALLAGVCGVGRGEGERAGVAQWVARAAALGCAAWMTVRSVAGMSPAEKSVIIAGLALLGSAVCTCLERGVKEAAAKPGAWPAAATVVIVASACSAVLILVAEVHTAAWMAGAVAAFFGACLGVGLATGRAMVGRGPACAAGVLLCGLLVHGWQYGGASDVEVGLLGSLLVVSAAAPVVAPRALGERGRGWGGVVACAVPAAAAMVIAAILRPPPTDI
ncbi:MAG TPA: hypothetical protein VFF65_05745 [Phycisphaerales bacterium]|nr:hypothetical protein [Phycisphaerales bacterium]